MTYVHLMEAFGTLGGGPNPTSQNHRPLSPPNSLRLQTRACRLVMRSLPQSAKRAVCIPSPCLLSHSPHSPCPFLKVYLNDADARR